MPISNRTRKLLWGNSGNRCAMCDTILAHSDGSLTAVLGDECHIAARSTGGPRFDASMTDEERDGYDNLILLCKNHHQLIDSNEDVFTVEMLRNLKALHEQRVARSTAPTPQEGFVDDVIVTEMLNGTELAQLVFDAHAYSFQHPHPTSKAMASAIAEFLQSLQDWGDISSDIPLGGRVDAAVHLEELLSSLHELGLRVVGGVGRWRHTSGILMRTAVVHVVLADDVR